MNSHDEKKSPLQPAPYEAPQVIRVNLRAEEAVLGHCKVTGQAGAVGGGCGALARLHCNALGS